MIVIGSIEDLARAILDVRRSALALAFKQNNAMLHDLAANGKDKELRKELYHLLSLAHADVQKRQGELEITPETKVFELGRKLQGHMNAVEHHRFVKGVCEGLDRCLDVIVNRYPAFGERSTSELMDIIHIAETESEMHQEVEKEPSSNS